MRILQAYCVLTALAVVGSAQVIQPPEEIGSLPGGNQLPRRERIPLTELTGLLRKVEPKLVVIEADDARLITVHLDGKTKFDPRSVKPGDTVFTSASIKDGRWTAVELRHVREGNAKERAKAAQPLPTNLYEPESEQAPPATPKPLAEPAYTPPPATTRLPAETDDEGRPRMRRGRPAGSTTLPPPTPAELASAIPPAAPPVPRPVVQLPGGQDPLIAKAREVSAGYSSTLPNFIARQFTTRYERQPRGDFQVQDQVECEVIVENGIEQYRNFKRGGRSLKAAPNDQGAWSSGEFRTLQSMVLDNSGATFFNRAKDTLLNRPAIRFQFSVPREASQWRVQAVSQVYLPAYSGTLWLDAETSNVLRIEIESRGIPDGFPVAKAETTIEYDFIALGGRKYLLPNAAALLTCEAGSKICSKNEIQFRHYKSFGADSKITFEVDEKK